MDRIIPAVTSVLRGNIIKMPEVIKEASGIDILGKHIQSIIFTTDLVLIRNNNADAIMAVYPFTAQPIITHAIISAADQPVFIGVGGGTTRGRRVVNLALDAEFQGALGVVLNSPIDNHSLKMVRQTVSIPIIVTVISQEENIEARLANGADILNVSAGPSTPQVVREIRKNYPQVPIIATGGPNNDSILKTIEAGANAITYTPPSNAELMRHLMNKYRSTLTNF
ncbi:hydrolase [Carboxydothermus hydrogenoformans]|uniref:Hydrolase n=1 Tax=Carboxydothermus hydrogenoformans (strain ATCC BAA-161 / DSM 6008 / Z-2901) TaxID=246194 RepID=Q3AE54_CARHZ|nr:conserved hypothetical protein [Carboxydothermus hydrogenoformans Z-2901]